MEDNTAPVEAPVSAPAVTEAPTEAPAYTVPEAYADKAWASNIKSEDDLYKQFDGAQALIGKKSDSIPSSDATDEEMSTFYDKLRPESFDKYELSLPEGVESPINQEEQDAYKQVFHDLGLSQKQADSLYKSHIEMESAKQAQWDGQLDKMLEAKYGDKANEAIEITLNHALDNSEGTKTALKELPPKQMMAMVDLINNLHAKLPSTKEDGMPDGGEQVTPTSLDEKIKESNRIRMSQAVKDPFHPDNAKMKAKLAKLDGDIAAS